MLIVIFLTLIAIFVLSFFHYMCRKGLSLSDTQKALVLQRQQLSLKAMLTHNYHLLTTYSNRVQKIKMLQERYIQIWKTRNGIFDEMINAQDQN